MYLKIGPKGASVQMSFERLCLSDHIEMVAYCRAGDFCKRPSKVKR